MTTIYTFKDNDGDYLVTNSPVIKAGIRAYQLSGAKVDAKGKTPVQALSDMETLSLLLGGGTLEDEQDGLTVEEHAAQLGAKLHTSEDLPEDNKLVKALA